MMEREVIRVQQLVVEKMSQSDEATGPSIDKPNPFINQARQYQDHTNRNMTETNGKTQPC